MCRSRVCLFILGAVLPFLGRAESNPSPIKIMCIGDSITAGKGYNWRFHLWKKLIEKGYEIDFVGNAGSVYLGDYDRDNEGYGGKTTDQVAVSSAAGIRKYQPDIALIHLGTNDFISQKQPAVEVAAEIGGIIDNLRLANPNVTVFVAKITFVSEEYAIAMEKLAAEKNTADSPVHTVDLRTGWQFEPGNDTVDYVHPNLNGVLKITDRLYAALETEFQRRGLPFNMPTVVPPTEPPNLALKKIATADVEKPGFKARKGVDGDWKSLWAAPDQTLPHWFQVDLETPQTVTGTGVIWDAAGEPYGYKIETSIDGQTWIQAADHTQNPKEISVALVAQKDFFAAEKVRFVRLTVTAVPNAPWTKYPASVREFHIYGSPP